MHPQPIVRRGIVASALLFFCCSLPTSALAQGSAAERIAPVTAGVDLLLTSAYVWRGFVPTDAVSLQPSPWAKAGPFTVTSWSNMTSRGDGRDRRLTEHDLTVDYTRRHGALAFSAGYINYLFPGVTEGHVSHEFYAGMTREGVLNPSVRVYHDISAGAGTYVSAGVSQSFTTGRKGVTLTPAVAVGYNRHQWTDLTGWSDLAVTLKAGLPPSGRITWSPFVTWSKSLNAALVPTRVYGGVGISVK